MLRRQNWLYCPVWNIQIGRERGQTHLGFEGRLYRINTDYVVWSVVLMSTHDLFISQQMSSFPALGNGHHWSVSGLACFMRQRPVHSLLSIARASGPDGPSILTLCGPALPLTHIVPWLPVLRVLTPAQCARTHVRSWPCRARRSGAQDTQGEGRVRRHHSVCSNLC